MYWHLVVTVSVLATLVEVSRGEANSIDGNLAQLICLLRFRVPRVVTPLASVVMHMHRGMLAMLLVVNIVGPAACRRLLMTMKLCLLAVTFVVGRPSFLACGA